MFAATTTRVVQRRMVEDEGGPVFPAIRRLQTVAYKTQYANVFTGRERPGESRSGSVFKAPIRSNPARTDKSRYSDRAPISARYRDMCRMASFGFASCW